MLFAACMKSWGVRILFGLLKSAKPSADGSTSWK